MGEETSLLELSGIANDEKLQNFLSDDIYRRSLKFDSHWPETSTENKDTILGKMSMNNDAAFFSIEKVKI